MVKAASGPGEPELARIRALPAPAGPVLARALEIDPARRFQSAGQFAAAVAPLVRASGNELAEVMQRLFAEEFRGEEKRFASAVPAAGSPGSSPSQVSSRRT